MADKSNPAPFLIGITLWVLTDFFLLKSAFADPGFVPR
jgi:hypothetical protein